MDPELKILLEQLISAISTPSEFDYVTLSVSITSALLSFCVSVLLGYVTYKLGKRQNDIAKRQNEIAEQQAELQKQQNEFVKQQIEIQQRQCEIEEFDIYKEMHRDIYKLQRYSNLVLPMIFGYFASDTANDQAQRVEELEKVFDELSNKIAVDEADFVLRKGENKEIKDAYDYACFVAFLLGIVPAYVKNNRPEQSDLDKLNQLRFQNGNNSDQEWLKALAPYLPNNAQLKATIDKFIEEKHLLFEVEDNLLERIRKSYKNEINE